jgi:hypothetical protein
MRFAPALLLSTALVLAGCAVSTQDPCLYEMLPEEFDDSATFSASFDNVWEALVDSVSDMEFPIEHIDKDSGIVNTDFVDLGRFRIEAAGSSASNPEWTAHPYVTCKSEDCLDLPGTIRGRFGCVVTENDRGVRIRVDTHFYGQKQGKHPLINYGPPEWEKCNSTGQVEALIFEKVRAYLDEG